MAKERYTFFHEPEEKTEWNKAAQVAVRSLPSWIRATLNRAAQEESSPGGAKK